MPLRKCASGAPAAGERLTISARSHRSLSSRFLSAVTRAGVILGSRPPEITLMNSTHAFSFSVSWSHGPAGAMGTVTGPSPHCHRRPGAQGTFPATTFAHGEALFFVDAIQLLPVHPLPAGGIYTAERGQPSRFSSTCSRRLTGIACNPLAVR